MQALQFTPFILPAKDVNLFPQSMKTLVQCDFDGTITEEDASFLLLDAFAQGDWRQVLQEYKEHRISVGEFNSRAFAMVKADESALLGAIKGKVKIRAGLHDLVAYCSRRGFRFVIVSNGLEFYIKAMLKDIGLENLEVYAAQSSFHPEGIAVQYIGPDGNQLNTGLKEAYIKLFLKQGYRVVYVGNGDSDILPAKYAHLILARGELLDYCRENNLECKPFNDFTDIVREMEFL
ncbi:MAG: MtnX-like HAD-IB family phosphatase [Dehalococcoidia bacterium]|nr:MtnX-like HAD-IB family phosphatase [Dehalococcoidia bacterium]